jgi:hypothetical protein
MSFGPASGTFARLCEEMDWIDQEEKRAACSKRRELIRQEAIGRREARRSAIQNLQSLRERLESIDRLMVEYFKGVTKRVDGMLESIGFHRHARGQWRRRRRTMGDRLDIDRYPGNCARTRDEIMADRARSGDPAALETCLQQAARYRYETVEGALLQRLSIGPGPPYRDPTEFVSVRLAEMRFQLAPPGSSEAEKLLADRAALCWLHLELLEYESARLYYQEIDSPKSEIIDRRLAKAQARFSQALLALAKVRRLAIPAVQINVARNQVNQMNVGQSELGERRHQSVVAGPGAE